MRPATCKGPILVWRFTPLPGKKMRYPAAIAAFSVVCVQWLYPQLFGCRGVTPPGHPATPVFMSVVVFTPGVPLRTSTRKMGAQDEVEVTTAACAVSKAAVAA